MEMIRVFHSIDITLYLLQFLKRLLHIYCTFWLSMENCLSKFAESDIVLTEPIFGKSLRSNNEEV